MSKDGLTPPPATCVWLTGLSGSGKSTTAVALAGRLDELGCRARVLDGDVVRAQRSPRLGFSRQDREANALIIAELACEAISNGEIAICAIISPYRDTRDRARAVIGSDAFIEVFVDTPLAVCEARDPKGLYRKARDGAISGLTGIDDPYEPPLSPDLRLTTEATTPGDNVEALLRMLERRGAIADPARTPPIRAPRHVQPSRAGRSPASLSDSQV